MSLSEVLEEMFGFGSMVGATFPTAPSVRSQKSIGFSMNAIDEERNGRKYSTEVQNTK